MRWLLTLSAVVLLSGCERLFFLPHSALHTTPDQLGLAHEEVTFPSGDGLELFGWFLPAQGAALGTILFLHGNAENISTHVHLVAWLPPRGFNVFLIDYRGYGASKGKPTLEGAQRDIDAAFRTLLQRADVDRSRIVMYGQSLGGALGLHNATHSPYRGHLRAVIADSAFSSYRGITREKLSEFWLTWPVQWVPWLSMSERYSPRDAIRDLSPVPVLIVHGGEDRIVPVHHAQSLFEAAQDPRELWIVPGANHIEAMTHAEWQQRLEAYLRKVLEQ
jgi:fermentation-respiration switch protein FrsA (DUF1100 family)